MDKEIANLKMKYLQLLILILLPFLIKAQGFDTVYVFADSIKENSISLDNTWRFHTGDDSLFASREFDASKWDTLRTNMRLDEIPPNTWKGNGWFRKVIIIDSSLIDKPIGLSINHYGASQIYLNGKMIKEFGKVGYNEDEEEIYQPRDIPFVVQLDSNIVYTIAIRYSNHLSTSEDFLAKWFRRAGFRIRISSMDDMIQSSVEREGLSFAVNMGIAGLFLSLAILYFLLFLFYSRHRENIYYSFFTFFIALAFMHSMLQRFIHTDITLYIILAIVGVIAISFIFPSYLGFLYSIFYKKMPKQFWVFIAVALLIVASTFTTATESVLDYAILGFIFLSTVEGLRVILLAIKKRKAHAWVIGLGVIVFVIFVLTLFVAGIFGININSTFGIILFFIGLLSLPASMSVYLARDIATTNNNLTLQLENVKDLSKKELEQQLRAQKAEAENERKSKELEEARQLQLSMLPKELPRLPNLDIAVYMKTATEVGGDYYDFHVGMDGTLSVVIGDATGHGLKAGTMVTITKSLFKSYINNDDILITFKEYTRVIKEMKMNSMTMCLSLLKIKDNKLEMSSAGMPHALLYRDSIGEIEQISLKGMPLGAFNDFPYATQSKELFTGDTLFLLSDGLPELFNKEREMFGYERITEEYEKVTKKSPEEIIEHMKTVGSSWADNAEPNDDITFVVIKIK
jgi:serine phosphatase RsbU (regulator of sigma subunit)